MNNQSERPALSYTGPCRDGVAFSLKRGQHAVGILRLLSRNGELKNKLKLRKGLSEEEGIVAQRLTEADCQHELQELLLEAARTAGMQFFDDVASLLNHQIPELGAGPAEPLLKLMPEAFAREFLSAKRSPVCRDSTVNGRGVRKQILLRRLRLG